MPDEAKVPACVDVERGLLGRLMDGRALPDWPHLKVDHFFSQRHRLIWGAVQALHTAHAPTDPVAVKDWLQGKGELSDLADVRYLYGLIDAPAPNVEWSVKRIIQAWSRRRAAGKAEELGRALLAEDDAESASRIVRLGRQIGRLTGTAAATVSGNGHLDGHSILEILEQPQTEIPWAIAPWLAREDIVIFAGTAGLGKSYIAMLLGFSLALGRGLLDCLDIQGGPYRVLYVDEESNARLVRWRVGKLIDGMDLGKHDARSMEFRYLPRQKQPLDLGQADRLDALATEIRATSPDFVILDSLKRFHRRDENSNADMSAVYADTLRPLADINKSGLIVIHHYNKPHAEGNGGSINRVRGASDIVASADQVWTLERIDGDLVLAHEKCRWSDGAKKLAVTIEDAHEGNGVRLSSAQLEEDGSKVILDVLALSGATGAARQAIVDALNEAGFKGDSRAASRALGKLHSEGKIRKAGNQRGMRYWLACHAPPDAT
jgi:hypothetical protein